MLTPLDDERALHRYAEGKWSIKEVVGHLADAERVFSYRAMRFGRADGTALPGSTRTRTCRPAASTAARSPI
jgi:hypothetical protein